MNFSTDCPFCINTKLKNNELVGLTNSPVLFENNNLYVQVDIAPLCLGHILIVTNEHYLNFYEANMKIKIDTIKLKVKLKEIYNDIYNSDILIFEHGSAKSGEAGSSIEHAHLHIIPCNFNVEETLTKLLGSPINCDILTNDDFHNEFSYIYICNDKSLVYKVDKLPHQFMREIIIKELGDNNYLWQDRCTTPNSKKIFNQTIKDLKDKIII